ncbi:MAG: hypothetical protein ACFFCZ_10370 [Promethearchaeota archaeon]
MNFSSPSDTASSNITEDDQPFWQSNKKQRNFVCKLFNFKLFSFNVEPLVFNFYLIPITLAIGNLISGLAGLYVFMPTGSVAFYTLINIPGFYGFFYQIVLS